MKKGEEMKYYGHVYSGAKKSKLIDQIRIMPPLPHAVPGEEFNIKHSEVMKWVLRNPTAWQYVWNHIKQSGAIKYDPETKKWRGVDYEPDKDSDLDPTEEDPDGDRSGEGNRTEKKWKAGRF